MAENKKLSKNVVIIIISVIIVAVLAIVLAVLTLTESNGDGNSSSVDENSGTSDVGDEISVDPALVLTAIDTQDVESVVVINKKDNYEIKRVGENFVIPDLKSAPSKSASIGDAVSVFTQIVAEAEVGKDLTNLDEYGLKEPIASVLITHKNGSIAFDVGNITPTGNGYYICQQETNDVFVAPLSVGVYAVDDKFAYVNLNLVTAATSNDEAVTVEKLTIKRRDKEDTILEKIPDTDEEDEVYVTFNTHMIISPIRVEADSQRADSIINGFNGFNAKLAHAVELDEVDYELAGLNNPTATILARTSTTTEEQKTTKNYKLTIGNPIYVKDEDGNDTNEISSYYGVFDGIDVLFSFSKESLPWIDFEVADIMSRRPLMPYIFSVDGVDFGWGSDESHKIEIFGNSDENSAKLDGKDISVDRVKELFQFLLALPGEDNFSGEVDGEPIAWFKYTHRDSGLGTDLVEIFESPDDRKIIVQINGTPLFKTRQMYGNKLVDNMKAFVNGGEISQDW